MAQNSFALMTNLGRAKEAAAIANGTAVVITHIAIGDGATVPSGGETALYHEIVRKTVSGHGTVSGAANVAYFDIFLAASEGPYTIREAGLIDQDGDLIAIARYDPPINKPIPSSGQTVEGTVRLEVAFSNVANVTIVVDPTFKVPMQRLTRLPWLPVTSMSLTVPPTSPAIGDIYLIPNGATGAWTGQAGKIAEYTTAGWGILTPPDGHGVGLPDGRVFERVNGIYIEFLASREWVNNRKAPITQLNSLPWLPVKSMTVTAPPAATEGDLYLIPTSATGAWAGKAGQIAEWSGAAWMFKSPADGHGVSLPDGRVFERVSGSYIEKPALDTQSGKWTYADATGSSNALIVVLAPALLAYTPGLQINIKVATTNTGAATINVNGLGAKSIVDRTGTALSAGDLVAGEIVSLVYDGTRFRTIGKSEGSNQIMGSAGWIKLPGGLIMQWGSFSGTTNAYHVGGVYESSSIAVTWPMVFPNGLFQCVAGCGTDVSGNGLQEQAWFILSNKAGGTALVACRQAGAALSGFYIVFGN